MTDPSPGTQGETHSLSAIEYSLADAHKKLSKLYDIQRASRVQLLILIGALVVVMLIFGTRIYSRVTENFNQNQVREQLMERLPILGQDVARQINPVLHEVAPVYAGMFKDRLVEIAPILRDDADQLIKDLPKQIHEDVMSKLKQSIDKVGISVQQDTRKMFPYLSDDRALGIMEHLTDALDRESKKVSEKTEVLFAGELHKVNDIMSRIEVPPVDKKDQAQVERELIHHLLMYMDAELMKPRPQEPAK